MSFNSKSKTVFTKKLLPAAIVATASLFVSVGASAGFPTIYGKIDVTLNQYDLEKSAFSAVTPATNPVTYRNTGATGTAVELDNWSLESNSSRFGVRGDFGITEGITAVYKVEYGIDVDNGTNSNGRELTQRNVYAGLQTSWGTVLVGKNDSPLKTVQTNSVTQTDLDRFNDLPLADIVTYLGGENRPDNVIQYVSPILAGGLEVNVALIQNEETGVEVNAINPQNDNGLGAGKSISVVYGKAKWFVGIAADDNVIATDAIRAVGEVTVGPVKIGAIYQTAERHETFDVIGPYSSFVNSSASTSGPQNGLNPASEWDGVSGSQFKEQDGYVLNALWKIAGPWSAKAQYGFSKNTPTPTPSVTPSPTAVQYDDVEITAIAVGVDYKLSDAAKLFAYYASVEAEGDTRINTETITDKTFAVGVDYKF